MADSTTNLINTGTTEADGTPIFRMDVAETTTPPSTQGMIRNINQTVQEREIIKTAPDLIIYLDGKTYLLNPYITNTTVGQPYTFVSFNDYVQNFSASYDVDQLVPSCNFTLQVPNMNKYLFQAPGGNNLIISMMEVQIFAKGYFPAGNGNTIYHRVFKGIVAHVDHSDNGMFLEISVQCHGILHLLDYMHVDLNPSNLTNSARPKMPMTSNQANMNPYEMLADTFLRGVTLEGFQLNAHQQDNLQNDYWTDAVKAGFCNKWQPILENLRKEVHILGYRMGEVMPSDIHGFTQQSPDSVGAMDPKLRAADAYFSSSAQNALNADFYVNIIRGYLPDMGTAAIQMLNGRIVSRLERIRLFTTTVGFEGFQDLDGTIIFKPPLYNLDVTNIGSKDGPQATSTDLLNITDANNPFIIHLSEIETELESEDEQGIKATRVTIQPNWAANNNLIPAADAVTRPAVTHIDIPKLARFGLREEPARTLMWLGLQDKVAAYTYAVSELNRGNRGWRSYDLTIPLRPELKLGFPIYLPHKDMYGYIKTISISYSQGGAATMSVHLDTLRKRPVFPQPSGTSVNYATQPNLVMQWTSAPASTTSSTTNPSTTPNPFMVGNSTNSCVAGIPDGMPSTDFTPNLVNTPATQLQPQAKPIYAEEMEVISARRNQYGTSWETKADTRTKNFRIQNDIATADDAKSLNGNGQPIVADGKATFFSATNWHASFDTATPATTTTTTTTTTTPGVTTITTVTPGGLLPFSQGVPAQITMENVGSYPFTPSTTATTTSPATTTTTTTTTTTPASTGVTTTSEVSSAKGVPLPPPLFNAAQTATALGGNKGINMTYLQKILSCQPYTDEGGYELVTPFPWGRWKSLTETIFETHLGVLVPNSTLQDVEKVSGTDVFLFAGVGSVVGSADMASSWQTQLNTQKNTLSNVSAQAVDSTTFELVNPPPGSQQPNILNNMQPDSMLLVDLVQNTADATAMFLAGNIPPQPGSALALATNLVTTE